MGVGLPGDGLTTAFFGAYVFTGVVSVGFLLYALQHYRDRPIGLAFAGLAGATAIWGLGYVGRLLATSIGGKLAWHAVAYLGILGVPPALVGFALAYTGRADRIGWPHVGGVLAVPALAWLLLVTNSQHGLFYRSIDLFTGTDPAVFTSTVGPGFWIGAAYSWALVLVAVAVLGRFALTGARLFRAQSVAVLVGVLVPWLLNVAYLAGLRLHPVLDPTPVGLTASLVAFGVAVSRARLLDIGPTARRTVVETIDDPVLVLDERARLVDLNRAATERFDLSEAAVGTGAAACFPADLWTALRDHDSADEWEWQYDTDGTQRTFLVRDRAITRAGRRLGTVLTLTDITTHERQRERLERFAKVVSHDLRNPLSLAMGRTRLARKQTDSEHLEAVTAAHERMDDLIEDLLALARAGSETPSREPVDLAAVVEDCWRTVETPEATLEVESGLTLRADRSRLRQLIENLIDNAVRHGGAAPTVRVGSLPEGTGFFVADDGPGIPTAARAQLFEDGVSTDADGLGLGLAIVREIADAHGWDVRVVEDAPGARFEIRGVEPA